MCRTASGAADYLTLARVFHTIILRNIPILKQEDSSEARRLITLIDTLYDQKVMDQSILEIFLGTISCKCRCTNR